MLKSLILLSPLLFSHYLKAETCTYEEKSADAFVTQMVDQSFYKVVHKNELVFVLEYWQKSTPISSHCVLELIRALQRYPYLDDSKNYLISQQYKTSANKILNLLKEINQKKKNRFSDENIRDLFVAIKWMDCKDEACKQAVKARVKDHELFEKYTQNLSHLPYTPQQQHINATQSILRTSHRIFILEGVPGAGKTIPVLSFVTAMLKSHGKEFRITAPNAGGLDALHEDMKEGVVSLAEILKGEIPQNSHLIIDEVYLLSLDQLEKVLQLAVSKNLSLIFSGDSQQNLPQESSIYGLLDSVPANVHLFDSNRANDPEQKRFARIAMQNNFATAMHKFEKQIQILNEKREEVFHKMVADMYAEGLKDKSFDKLLMIGPKKYIEQLNDLFNAKILQSSSVQHEIQVAYQDLDLVTNEPITIKKNLLLGIGSRIMLKASLPQAIKGDMGTVKKIDVKELVVKFKNKTLQIPLVGELPIELAYALESASSQGLTVQKTFAYVDRSLDRAALYVLLTRHKSNVFIYSSSRDFPSRDILMNFNWVDRNRIERLRAKLALF